MSGPTDSIPGRALRLVDPVAAPAPDELTPSLGTDLQPKARKPRKSQQPLPAPTPARPPRELTQQEAELQQEMINAFFNGRRPARNHSPASIKTDLYAVNDLLGFIGQPLWLLTEGDFEAWSAHLGITRALAAGTQRRMQGSVATFMRYLVHHQGFQNKAFQLGGRLQEIAHPENRIIHTIDSNPTRKRHHLTSEEFQALVAVQDAAIEIAATEAPRRLRALMRDKAMFLTFYTYGLRLAEGHGLNTDSFRPNPTIPELGSFGIAHVYGKGANGSGPRFRAVPAILPDIRPVLEWYQRVVRPLYQPADDQKALWLSEGGRRLARSSIDNRFKFLVEIAGYERIDMSLHGLRHMSVSHEAEADIPLHFTQQRHGHVFASTTQQYTHLTDKYIQDTARRLVSEIYSAKEDQQ